MRNLNETAITLGQEVLGNIATARRLSSSASYNPYREDFDPVLFLLKIHSQTPAKDLASGYKAVKRTVDSRQQQMRDLVSAHFDQFISCKNTIDVIEVLLREEVSATESKSRTGQLEKKMKGISDSANRIYGPLLERKAEADKIRNVLAVLKRFDFLFALPGSLQYNIEVNQKFRFCFDVYFLFPDTSI
jgi:exocyst complex component 2